MQTEMTKVLTMQPRVGVQPDLCRVLEKQHTPGHDLTVLDWQSHQEFHLTLRPLPGEAPTEMVRRLVTILRERNASVVRHEIFGLVSAHAETLRALWRELNGMDWPVTWVEGSAPIGRGIAGMHIFAVAGPRVDSVREKGEPIGRIYGDGRARHCFLGNLVPSNLSASKPTQCRELFERTEHLLLEADMGMADVARTWFFLDDILSWYEEFNDIRTGFLKERKLLANFLPASTGIGGCNPTGAAVAGGIWAVQSAGSPGAIQVVPSPLQCSSMEYGSAFSRAVLTDEQTGRRLLISGTASIGPDGRSSHTGNVREQIELSMEVVREILASRGFDFSDVTRATAYLKNIQDAPTFEAWRKKQRIDAFPVIVAQATICRRELLFEIELDAILSQKHSAAKPQPKWRNAGRWDKKFVQ
jgi:enamine deaminase RidA (YjgF/YER057c/UK114 family)